jgi:DNA-binding XRE family transcriptional regulator
MANNKKDALKKYGEHLFVEKGWKQNAIAEFLEVAPKTIVAWKKEDKWDEKKMLLIAAPHTIKSTLVVELQKVINGEKSNVDADALSKLWKVLSGMQQELSAEVCMSVFEEFDLFMINEDSKIAYEFTNFHRKFLLHKINQTSNG